MCVVLTGCRINYILVIVYNIFLTKGLVIIPFLSQKIFYSETFVHLDKYATHMHCDTIAFAFTNIHTVTEEETGLQADILTPLPSTRVKYSLYFTQ